jgi:hypothetical protein
MEKELGEVCITMVRHGEDFPTVWRTYLKDYALVIGPPESKLEWRWPVTEIKLVTGELCWSSDENSIPHPLSPLDDRRQWLVRPNRQLEVALRHYPAGI